MQWLSIFEAQCRALEFPEENHTFFFSTEDGAFSTILTSNCENNAISYHRVKRMLIEKYSGEEYERHLEIKFRNLKHRAHKTIPKLFMNLALQFVIIMAWPNQPDRYESYTFILRGLYS